jgi:ferric-dicitrate binding protein FerR (iron transport regulator)
MRARVLLNLAPLLGCSADAARAWSEVLAADPRNAKGWEEASVVLAHLGQLPLAVHAAQQALSLRPADVTLHERLIVLLAAQEVRVPRGTSCV